MTQGRPTKGPDIVNDLDASGEAKKKVRLVLETLSGKTAVKDAAASLGISESQFHRVREDILMGMLKAAEPKPLGRPPAPDDPAGETMARLRARISELEGELDISQLREVLAVLFPDMAREGAEERKKKRLSRIVTSRPPEERPGFSK